MHEASIALSIVDEVSQRLAAEPIERVTAVYVNIGKLTGVVPDALQFAWDLATDGTPAAGARLVIEEIPLSIWCDPCAQRRTISSYPLPVCPDCGTPSAKILAGRELFITRAEVEYDPTAAGRSTEHFAQEHRAGSGTP
ncbi:MAG TPA: hydrogenase maturation nickel metallochaperone HypA [Candidatus Baltobacteraceae bacterium]|nr:hydrogenase maturation nickel metallochaperone HypA [Candidatus Baltobacteraceae bacterium]